MIYANPNTTGAKLAFKPAYDNFIGGKWVTAASRFDVLDPATGDVIASVADGSVEDAAAAFRRLGDAASVPRLETDASPRRGVPWSLSVITAPQVFRVRPRC